jgi:phage terminase large subunit GpA-like protein
MTDKNRMNHPAARPPRTFDDALLRYGAPCPHCGGTQYRLEWHPPTVYECLACELTILARMWKAISATNPRGE